MADPREGWMRDRARSGYDDDRDWYRRHDEDWERSSGYGRSGYGRPEGGRRADWRREGRPGSRGEAGYRGEDWGRRDWRGRDRERDYGGGWGRYSEDRDRYRREGWGRGDWNREGRGDDYDQYGYGRRPRGTGGYDEGWGRDPGWEYGTSLGGYGRSGYGRDRYGEPSDYDNRRGRERGWWDRTSDEVSSWFGDEAAERRRQDDERRRETYRGRGPRGYARSDERVREDVSDRLTDNPILDASEIDLMVENGEVTLSGSVDSRYSKRLAEDIAEEISGVRHVQNNLRVRQWDRQGDPQRESISGTYSGIAEGGRTSDLGRTSRSATAGTTAGGTGSNADTERLGGATTRSAGGKSTDR